MIVQIYEVQTADEAEALMGLGTDHIGSVIPDENHWKDPQIKAVVETVQEHAAKSSLIPLFNRWDALLRALDFYRPDMVHFCEDLLMCDARKIQTLYRLQEKIRLLFPRVAIMRTLPVPVTGQSAGEKVLALSRRFDGVSDFFLADTHVAQSPVTGYTGITGRPCDWNVAAALVRQSRIPVILAGGLSPENVFEAILCAKPAGVDSCTQTNARDASGSPTRFRKDLCRVKGFIEEVRRAEKALSEAVEIDRH